MGNQALTPTTTTTMTVLSISQLSQPLSNVVLRVVTTDDTGKALAPFPPIVPFKEIGQEGFAFTEYPLVFQLIKHPEATHFRVTLESKGTFSNSVLGEAYFSAKSFEHDKNIAFDIDFLSRSEQKIGTIQLQIFIPGAIFERNLLLKYSLEQTGPYKQIHFKHGHASAMNGASEQLSNFYSLLGRVLEFSEDYKSDVDIYDITTSPSLIQPLVIVTLKFKHSFIQEASSKFKQVLNEKGQLLLPSFGKLTLLEVEKLNAKYELKTRIFYKTCEFDINKLDGYLKSSESIHSRNIAEAIEWIHSTNYRIISKNFEWTTDGNKSICIIWYYDDETQNLKKYSLLEEEERKSSFNKIELYATEQEVNDSEYSKMHHSQSLDEDQFGEEENPEELLIKVQDKNKPNVEETDDSFKTIPFE